MWALLGFAIIVNSIVGCSLGDTSKGGASSGRISPTYTGPVEKAYCSTAIVYGMPKVTVTGTAEYTRRNTWGTSGSGNGGLGGASTSSTHAASVHPIRRAEVRVTDAAGNVVQCATTSATGTFSLELPQGNVNYTLSVNSRASNSYLAASVLNQPEQNVFYSLSTTVNAASAPAALTLMAPANGAQVLGAAFNILDQLLEANEYLRAQVGTCSTSFPGFGCADFTVAPKVVAYWTVGYNPNGYFNSTSGLSFYLPDYYRLFILGGQSGDVDHSDTDHFDNSVILHEYGHFLEDSMAISDSPGGSHNGDRIIDPRLAWSEGWGNFFQAAVRYSSNPGIATPRYTDTLGNDDGTTSLIYDANLETVGANNDDPEVAGEGNFREFSVTRMLWDAIDTNADGPTHGATDNIISGKFPEIWAVFTKATNGLKDTDWAFRNVGLLHYGQSLLTGGSNWSTIRTVEWHDGNANEYAKYVTPDASNVRCLPFVSGSYTRTMTPTTTYGYSNLLRNHDFYHIKISSTTTTTFRLDFADSNGAGVKADLDLYLFNEDATLSTSSSDIIAKSREANSGGVGAAEFEQFTVTLAPGNYLLDVTAYVGGGAGTAADYSIKQGGNQLCPDTL